MFPNYSGLVLPVCVVVGLALIPGMAIGYFIPKVAILGPILVITGLVTGLILVGILSFVIPNYLS